MVNLDAIRSGKRPRKKSPQGELGGTRTVAEKETREGLFDAFSKLSEACFSVEGAKKAAAWYIESSEKAAKDALGLQEKATAWAKETPLASLFEAQNSMARKFIERSASAARSLWQIQE
jgi:hypothetical protein